MTAPLVSVITVVYNDAVLIDTTIKSIAEHKSDDIEYIIIDGGSTDDTVNVIKAHHQHINYWLSEPDKGIYDAINKGIKIATGNFVCFINAGDELIHIPSEILRANQKADLLCFPVLLSTLKIFYPQIGNKLKIRNTLPHQGCFYKRSPAIFYDTTFKVFADFSLNQNLYKQNKVIKIFNEPVVAKHSLDGISHDKKHGLEIFEVVSQNFGVFYKALSFLYFKWDGVKNRFLTLLK